MGHPTQFTEYDLLTTAITSCDRPDSCFYTSFDAHTMDILLGVNCVRLRTAEQPNDYRLLRPI